MSWTEFKRLEKKLAAMGLSKYEAQAYLVIMLSGRLPAQRVAELTSIPKTKIYQVCDKLVEKGMLAVERELEIVYVAKPPDEAINNYLRWCTRVATERVFETESIAQKLADISVDIPEPRIKEPYVVPYVGMAQIEKKLSLVAAGADEIIVMISSLFSPLIKFCRENPERIKKVICPPGMAKNLKVPAKNVVEGTAPVDMLSASGTVFVLNSKSVPPVLWEFVDEYLVEFLGLSVQD